jgi:hypothetical protein
MLLSATEDRLRFAIAGRGDVTELRLRDERWLGENGEVVELGALIPTEKAAKPKSRLRAMAVGRPS